jgi:DNA-binding NarL/FixJ family response regulator
MVRQAIKATLGQERLEVVAEASDGREAVNLCRHLQPEVAILDVSMPGLNGIEATREVIRVCPNTKVVMLSEHTAGQYVVGSLEAGARAYVLKAGTTAELAQAVYAVFRGETYISPGVFPLNADQTGTEFTALTVREREVLQLIAEGKSNKEIADTLNISYATVRSHRSHIIEKLNVHATADLVRYSIRQGLSAA